jgi:uncharacterized ion transporter superfamily protein YfcC
MLEGYCSKCGSMPNPFPLTSLADLADGVTVVPFQLNVIGLMVWWKMHYLTIYCTQLIEEQTTQWSKEKVKKDKQRFSKHAYKTKDRVSRTTLRTNLPEHICLNIKPMIIHAWNKSKYQTVISEKPLKHS